MSLILRLLLELSFILILTFNVVISARRDIYFMNGNKTNAQKPLIEGKIVGGEAVPIQQYPFAAIVFNYGALCGGTILSSWAVLTAAHCFDSNEDVFDITIHVGTRYKFDAQSDVHYVQYLERHKDYNKAMPFACDIAMLFVEDAFQFKASVQRAIVVNNNRWMQNNQKNFTVTGWGMIKYNGPTSQLGLLMAQLEYVPLDECGKLHDMNFTEDMFCLYGNGEKDTCKGDSGGGVLWNGFLVGIVSHGDGCAGKDKPSVYSNVFYFRRWIYDTINNFYSNNCELLLKKLAKLNKPTNKRNT